MYYFIILVNDNEIKTYKQNNNNIKISPSAKAFIKYYNLNISDILKSNKNIILKEDILKYINESVNNKSIENSDNYYEKKESSIEQTNSVFLIYFTVLL